MNERKSYLYKRSKRVKQKENFTTNFVITGLVEGTQLKIEECVKVLP